MTLKIMLTILIRFRFIFLSIFCLYVLYFVKSIYFSVDQKPVKSDVIIVLSGESGRLETAYNLYKLGYADTIMLSNSHSRLFQKEIKKLKIPDTVPFIDEPNATSTYTNAKYTLVLMEKCHFTSAIVVSSNYHMDRVRLAYDRVLGKTQVKLTYVASYGSSMISPSNLRKRLKLELEEPIKYLGYVMFLYHWIDL